MAPGQGPERHFVAGAGAQQDARVPRLAGAACRKPDLASVWAWTIRFVDPEGLLENGVFKEYPIEGAREGDVVVRQEAIPALERLRELLNV
ncbi:hypothetical protein [Streptomyces sp. NBC_01506]|uniref:hypothetical protein n=1 Tax=Streptomyces sp. NBC_01506 TaxID=2903887 RepID=UPI00386AEE84